MALQRTRKKAVATRHGQRSQHSRKRERPGSRRIDLTLARPPLQFNWAAAISADEWQIYGAAIETVRTAGLSFMLGGGFAGAAYTGFWRDTKDIDFYILPSDREPAVKALREAGFQDYYDRVPYDRNWIARNVRGDVIIDIIWAMANQRAQVDKIWFERAGSLTLRNQHLLIVPPEEFMWCKLYIMQRDHCDWTDEFNLLYAHGDQLDWDHLVDRVGEDADLLKALLTAYRWLQPQDALKLPGYLWKRLGLPPPEPPITPPSKDRVRLLDSREWFIGSLQENKKLGV